MLSFPRDLFVEIHCPGQPTFSARINGAYSECGTKGTLETVRKLTGLPINYLITVNFRGFRQLVDAVGGVWMDVDRRYFNDQRRRLRLRDDQPLAGLPEARRLPGARLRPLPAHRLRPLPRSRASSCSCAPSRTRSRPAPGRSSCREIVKTITENVEVGQGGNKELDLKTVLRYALFAYSLPPGHFFQSKLEGLEETAGFDILVPEENIQKAVQEFAHPDVESPQKATAVALNEKPKPAADKAPAAARDDDQRAERQRRGGLGRNCRLPALAARLPDGLPPDGKNGNAPNWEYFKTQVQYDPAQRRRGGGGEEGREPLRHRRTSSPLDAEDRAALERRDADRRSSARPSTARSPRRRSTRRRSGSRRTSRPGADASLALLRERAPKVPFQLMVPTVLERTLLDRPRAAGAHVPDRPGRQAQDDPPRLPHGRERVLGRPEDRLGGRAGRSPSATSPARSGAGATSSTTRARSCTWSCSGRAARPTGS